MVSLSRRSSIVLCALIACGSVTLPRGARLAAEDDPLAALSGLSGAAAVAIATDLACDAMRGRRTGFPSGRKAEDYLAQAMGEIGLDPKDPAGSYLDPFEFAATQITGLASLTIGELALAYGSDFVELEGAGGREKDVEAEVVFVGYGLSAPEKGFDEYAGLDVKGKVVLALGATPPSRAAALAAAAHLGAKSALAGERGAVAFLFVGGETATRAVIEPRWVRRDLPALALSRAAADHLLASAKTNVAQQIELRNDAKEALPALPLPTRVRVSLRVEQRRKAMGHNGLGAIRGTDPDLRDEIVLVGAHFDHLGVDGAGRVYNGADENASGTAVLLHLARTLVDAGWRPRRTVLFVAFGASDQGLAGSRHLADGLPFEHAGITCVLNVRRVGQGKPAVALQGSDRFPAMGARLKSYLPEALAQRVDTSGAADLRADQAPFADRGVPAFLLSTQGEHPNVGSVDDDPERLDAACLEAAARVLGTLVVRLATEPERLVTPK